MSNKKEDIIDVRNPRTGAYDFTLKITGKQEISQIVERLRENQFIWRQKSVEERITVMQTWSEVLKEYRTELINVVTVDTGRKYESIREVDNLSKWIDKWSIIAKKELQPYRSSSSLPMVEAESDYAAYPIAGIISPWNFPLSLSLMDAIPALLAGCATIIKPSEITPRFIEVITKTIDKVPELSKVLKYVPGDGSTGAALIENVDMVCFTGSVKTGRMVAIKSAERFIPSFLELGGKDPAIILKSADIDRATSAILFGSVLGAGQQCYSLERLYVDESIVDKFILSLKEKANKLTLAYPTPESGEIGPIISEDQAEILADQLQDAIDKGAIVHCGGEIENLGGGKWCRPTVISNVNSTMKIASKETFGPIMPIISFTNLNKAIEMANDSDFGLSGAVFAGSKEEAMEVAQQLEVGGVSINDAGITPFFIGDDDEHSKNSFKNSGLGGSRLGSKSINRFIRRKAIFSNSSSTPSPWWFTLDE